MKACFVTDKSVSSFWETDIERVGKVPLLCFGFNGLGLVSYKKELKGETEYFHDVAKLSAELKSVVISGCDTDTYGTFRHSAVIADKGKLLGVSDMAHCIDESEFVPGCGFRVYDTGIGKIGIIVGEDLFFPESARILSLCDADLIICLFNQIDGTMPQVMLRAGAFANGVTAALCASNYACVSDIRGKIVFSGKDAILKTSIKTEKDYHLISSRRRGLYREFGTGY